MRFCAFCALSLCAMIQTNVSAQTVRFSTNVGSFDMVLNPNNDANLQPLVDNIVAYVGLGRYHFSALNRAADSNNTDPSDDFVLQMGGFLGFPGTPDLFADFTLPVKALEPVVIDADGDGQVDFSSETNDRGSVSLALTAGNLNSGTNSFFVNLGDNSFLDGQGFVPFANIENMDTIDRIMALTQNDISSDVGEPGNLAFVDVPVTDDGRMVVVTDVEVVNRDANFSFVGPIATALDLAIRNRSDDSAAGTGAAASSIRAAMSAGGTISAVPEPGGAVLGCFGMWILSCLGRRKIAKNGRMVRN